MTSSAPTSRPSPIGDGKTSSLFPSPLGFGCMGITSFYGAPLPQSDATSLLAAAYAQGYRHYDTAEIYKTAGPFTDDDGGVYNEAVCSSFFNSVPRDSFTVATKIHPGKWGGKTDYDTVRTALVNSLARLRLDYVDLYYCHRIPSKAGALTFMASCKRLVAEGLVRHVGLSEISGAWLREAHAVHPVAAVEQEWSLLTRGPVETELAPVCAELGVAIVAYSPLARNMLCTGAELATPKDWRATLPRYAEENAARNKELMAEVAAAAASSGCTAAQLSLAWLLKRGAALGVTIVPIPGTTKAGHAADNFAATEVVLADSVGVALETLASRIAGARGTPAYCAAAIEGQLPDPAL